MSAAKPKAKKPRKAPAHRVPKARMISGPRIPTTILTERDAAQYTYDKSGARTGCIIKTIDGYVGWSLRERLGVFRTAAEAEIAIARPKAPKPKSKAWENRS